MANDGYLFRDQSHPKKSGSPQRTAAAAVVDHDVPNESFLLTEALNRTGFKFAMTSEKPLSEHYHGSLYGKSFHYRNQDLTFD